MGCDVVRMRWVTKESDQGSKKTHAHAFDDSSRAVVWASIGMHF